MKLGNFIALIENGALSCAIELMLTAFPSSSVNAEQPSGKQCISVSKQEL
jgi:hypothetical protein